MDQLTRYHAFRRRQSRQDPASGLYRTHRFAIGAAGIATGTVFPSRAVPFTLAVKVRVITATAAGVIFELGSETTGLALWIASADRRIHLACGDAAAADGITLQGPVTRAGGIYEIVAATIPADGLASLWVNGRQEATGRATGLRLPNGWADAGAGAVGHVEGTVTTRVTVADRIALTDAAVISAVSCFQNQRPIQMGG